MTGLRISWRAASPALLGAIALGASCSVAGPERGGGAGGKADDFACSERARLEPFSGELRFDAPVELVQNPGNELRWYVAEQTGVIWTFLRLSGTVTAEQPFADLTGVLEAGPPEAGLLGLAFHPRFLQNGEVFLSYTAPDPSSPSGLESRVSRFLSSDNGRSVEPGSEEVLLAVDQPFENHNGGHITFGPDGFLYIGFGDGGGAGDPAGNAQDPDSLLGKILRIDVDRADGERGLPYAVPEDNPLASGGGAPEVFALGLRNPWRFSFDPDTGTLWAGDVGEEAFEEIDLIEAGGNYGWPIREGAHCFGGDPCDSAGLIDPISEYGRDGGISVTGGFVYRGIENLELDGAYVFADFGSGKFFTLSSEQGETFRPPELLFDSALAPTAFAQDARGEIYVADFASGQIFRVAPGGDCGGEDEGPSAQGGFGFDGPPSFSELYDEVIAVRCSPCHTSRALGDLAMSSADAAFEALVDQPARTDDCGGRTRVVPGDADASLLFQKVSGEDLCGPKMPLGGELEPEAIEAIRAWIDAGAPR